MNWDVIGAIGEIVGALAVVVSLVYLAQQIRIQNQEARNAALHAVSVGYRDTLATIADGDIADIIHKAISDYDSLTGAEQLKLIAVVGRLFRLWEETYWLHQAQRLEERMWRSMLSQFQGYMSVTPFAKVWELRKDYFDPEFTSFVDSLDKQNYRFK